MTLALWCVASVVCGAALVRVEGPVTPTLILALGLFVAVWLRARADRSSGSRPESGLGPRQFRLAAASLLVIGLARGASVGAPIDLRVPERGGSTGPVEGSLREFEVVGASRPGPRCEVELRDPEASRGPTLTVSAPPEACPLAAGQRVAVTAQALAETWRDHLFERGPRARRSLGRGPVIWPRPGPTEPGLRLGARYWRGVAALRQRAWASTRGDPSASLVAAVGLGLRSALAPAQREQLRAAGLGHLIAVSGLHVAIAALWLQALVRRGATLIGASPRSACVLAWLPLWAYVGLTGAAPSAVRAALMLTGVDLAALCGRPRHGPTLLASTAAAMLLWQPQWLFEPGFALSLAAMAAIVSAPAELGLLAMSWRITWATAPLSVLWFEVAPLHGLLANAFALPLFALMMPLALVAVLAPGPVGACAMSLAKLGAAPILDLAALLARLPSVGPGALLVLAGAGLLAHRLVRRWSRRRPGELERGEPPGSPGPPSGPPWLPPRLACALAVVIAGGLVIEEQLDRRGPSDAPLEFDWVAVGSVYSRSLLLADPSDPGAACLHRPTGSNATWIALLEQLGVTRLSRLDAALPDPDRPERTAEDDPRTRELEAALVRAGVELGSVDHCRAPPAAEVRAALRACQFVQAGRARALVRSQAGATSCRVADRWVVLELAGPER